MDATKINQLTAVYRDGLLNNTLPFWLDHAVDREHGGFLTSSNQDGPVIDSDKSVWQQGRFAWLLGKLYNTVERRDEWLETAVHGGRFIENHCIDRTDGRLWFLVDKAGCPLRKRRYSYSESFAAMAFGELAAAMGNEAYGKTAERLFQQFLANADKLPAGEKPKFTSHRQVRSIGVPMIAIGTAQNLRQSIALAGADKIIDDAIETITQFHVKPDIGCVMETVAADGSLLDHFDGRTLNPGHAIEAAWFIMREGNYRGDESLIRLGCNMLDWMWDRGWDDQFGGMLYFVDVNGLPVSEYWHDMKFWWPHNETIIATLMAWLLTGDKKYERMHQQVHDWAYEHFPDNEHGEWFGYLRRDGSVSTKLKGNHWKGPFHLPRMQMVCWKLLEEYKAKHSE